MDDIFKNIMVTMVSFINISVIFTKIKNFLTNIMVSFTKIMVTFTNMLITIPKCRYPLSIYRLFEYSLTNISVTIISFTNILITLTNILVSFVSISLTLPNLKTPLKPNYHNSYRDQVSILGSPDRIPR